MDCCKFAKFMITFMNPMWSAEIEETTCWTWEGVLGLSSEVVDIEWSI